MTSMMASSAYERIGYDVTVPSKGGLPFNLLPPDRPAHHTGSPIFLFPPQTYYPQVYVAKKIDKCMC